MSHYAKVVNGVVTQVIAAEEDFFKSFVDSSPGEWVKTSYGTKGGIHYSLDSSIPDNGLPLRGNYAGIGYVYDSKNDVFYPAQPYPSWVLNNASWEWEAPIPYPTDGKVYKWNEVSVSWQEIVRS